MTMPTKKPITVKMSQLTPAQTQIPLYSADEVDGELHDNPVDFDKALWAKDPKKGLSRAIYDTEMAINPDMLTTITKIYQSGSAWVAEGEFGRDQPVIYALSTTNPNEAKAVVNKWLTDRDFDTEPDEDEAADPTVGEQ